MGKTRWSKIKTSWRKRAREIERVALKTHIVVLSFSLIIGILLFLLFNQLVLPHSLPLPKTTAINWFVLHKHSLTLDYIRFIFFIAILQVTMIIFWTLFIWKRRK